MKNTDPNYYRTNQILVLFMIAVGLACYSLLQFLDWSADKNSAALIALQQDSVSGIKIYNGESTQESPLVTLIRPKDNELVHEFVRAINQAVPWEPLPRELITSHELVLVISLDNSAKPIELLFRLHEDCGNAVYINILTTSGGARSEADLYAWLQRINLLNYLGCN